MEANNFVLSLIVFSFFFSYFFLVSSTLKFVSYIFKRGGKKERKPFVISLPLNSDISFGMVT